MPTKDLKAMTHQTSTTLAEHSAAALLSLPLAKSSLAQGILPKFMFDQSNLYD
jgi:hypothetical protein